MLLAFFLGACISPPNRDLEHDKEIEQSTIQLQPEPRLAVDTARPQGTPKATELASDVRMLASNEPLERMQANTRLRAAGQRGVLAAARALGANTAKPAELFEAARFLEDSDTSQIDPDALEVVRAALASQLRHEDSAVRIRAARALQVHGPGSQRTVFLQAVTDAERRVRWAVVRRFSDNPGELKQAQREILLNLLRARSGGDFQGTDGNQDGKITRDEFTGSDDEFTLLDHDADAAVSLQEWTTGAPAAIRGDIVELLLRLHAKHSPATRPPGYNPYAPAADQQAAVQRWTEWSASLPE